MAGRLQHPSIYVNIAIRDLPRAFHKIKDLAVAGFGSVDNESAVVPHAHVREPGLVGRVTQTVRVRPPTAGEALSSVVGRFGQRADRTDPTNDLWGGPVVTRALLACRETKDRKA